MDDFERELKVGFLDEAAQSIADVEQCFLSLETNPDDAETLNKIFRLAHNLKGSSKAVGFDQMGAFTHDLETFILKVQKGEIPSSKPVISLLLKCNDFVGQMIQTLKTNLEAQFEIQPLMEEMKSSSFAEETPNVPSEPLEEDQTSAVENVQDSNGAEEDLSKILSEVESSIAPIPEIASFTLPEIPDVEGTAPAIKAEVKAQKSSSTAPPPTTEETIRISVSKVEMLLNSIGEMVILQSVIREQAMLTESQVLKKTLHQFEKVTKEIQDLSMSLRMVPVKPTFQKMQRIVRDTATALKKDVGIQLIGEETELDKTVLEKINDPLVHLVRNGVDHGIESAEARLKNGKPARGTVTLAAYHKSGKLILEVSDDGGGLDPEKLKKKAIEKGLIRPETLLSEKDAFNLIFAPGFSTKEVVTDVSGRGVGMDVVRTNIQDLSGEITINSVLGKGTTIQIILPLTLAIIEGMVLTFGPDRYVIPFSHVFETLRPSTKDIQHNSSLGKTLMLRGENMPIYKLGDFFGKKSSADANDMIAMVIRSTPKPFALLVDDILGLSQVVVKQLGPELQGFKGVSGCTILGDGKPALIIEPVDIVKRKITPAPQADAAVGGKVA